MARHGTRLPVSYDLRELVAERIRQAQKDRGLKTEELARETGISLRLVQKHRAAHNAPNMDSLSRYAKVLGKPIPWFITEDAA